MRDVEKPDNTHYVYLKFVMAILAENSLTVKCLFF